MVLASWRLRQGAYVTAPAPGCQRGLRQGAYAPYPILSQQVDILPPHVALRMVSTGLREGEATLTQLLLQCIVKVLIILVHLSLR